MVPKRRRFQGRTPLHCSTPTKSLCGDDVPLRPHPVPSMVTRLSTVPSMVHGAGAYLEAPLPPTAINDRSGHFVLVEDTMSTPANSCCSDSQDGQLVSSGGGPAATTTPDHHRFISGKDARYALYRSLEHGALARQRNLRTRQQAVTAAEALERHQRTTPATLQLHYTLSWML